MAGRWQPIGCGRGIVAAVVAAFCLALSASAWAQEAVFERTSVSFGPATPVSVTFLAPEPTLAVERRLPGSGIGAGEARRIFVSSLLGGNSMTAQIHRSVDGGDSFRLLVDPACAWRQRPTCVSNGGGDADAQVNPYTGTLFFTELGYVNELLNITLASSTDHGDTFPVDRQFLVTNPAPRPDRPWLTALDPSLGSAGGLQLEALLAYSPPGAAIYVQGVSPDGSAIPQPVPQLAPLYARPGRPHVDDSEGPGRGWIYLPYLLPHVGVATAPISDYPVPSAWQATEVAPGHEGIFFPALDLDADGNAYLAWDDKGRALLSLSPIADARNDPGRGGRPGTYWTAPVAVSPPDITSAALTTVAAGDGGRVAVAFMGSPDCEGRSDDCPDTARWRTYAGIVADGLAAVRGEPLQISLGVVSGRVNHRGNICSQGGGCGGLDRSLLEYFEARVGDDGRLGVAFMDNNNRMAAPSLTDPVKDRAFAFFARQARGPSLLAARSPLATPPAPFGERADPAADATWPNTSAGAALPSLDLLGTSLGLEGSELVAKLRLAEPTTAALARDLAAFNAMDRAAPPADRVHEMVWFATADDVFHLSMDASGDGEPRFFGGRLSENDRLRRIDSNIVAGARYLTDGEFPVTGSLDAGGITLRAPAAAFGVSAGTPIFSVTGVAMAAPAEDEPTAAYFVNSATTIDATPPFDVTLGSEPAAAPQPLAPRVEVLGVPRRLAVRRLLGRGLRLRVRANQAVEGSVELVVGRAGARRLGLRARRRGRPIVLSRVPVRFRGASERRLVLRPRGSVRRRLRTARRARVPATVRATGGGARASARLTLVARRQRRGRSGVARADRF